MVVDSSFSKYFLTLDLDIQFVYALPLLFLVGRVIYALAYIIATVIRISSVRSLGFSFVIAVNYLIIFELILKQSTFQTSFLFNWLIGDPDLLKFAFHRSEPFYEYSLTHCLPQFTRKYW